MSVEEKQKSSSSSNLLEGLDQVRQCSFMKHCETNASILPEPLWYAWITNAARCVEGREYIHKFSTQYPGYSKLETDKKIHHALQDTCPMTHETIENLEYKCDCPSKFKAPISRAYYRDVQAEVERIKEIKEHDTKLIELKSLIAYIKNQARLPIPPSGHRKSHHFGHNEFYNVSSTQFLTTLSNVLVRFFNV